MPASKQHSNPTAAERLEQEVVARALRKVVNREELTREERSALKRHERKKEEESRWRYYESIPQKHWRQMSGRQSKVINEQAARYGLPFGGPTIDLPAVVKALHDFLAANATKLALDDDSMLNGPGSPALERYREERAAIARLDRLEREGSVVKRDEVRSSFGRIATILRGAGDNLKQQFGDEAVSILHEALEDALREIDRLDEGTDNDKPDE